MHCTMLRRESHRNGFFTARGSGSVAHLWKNSGETGISDCPPIRSLRPAQNLYVYALARISAGPERAWPGVDFAVRLPPPALLKSDPPFLAGPKLESRMAGTHKTLTGAGRPLIGRSPMKARPQGMRNERKNVVNRASRH